MSEQTVIVDLADWREYRRRTFGVTEDLLRANKPFEVIMREKHGDEWSYLVTQGQSAYWLPSQFVHVNGNGK